MKKRLSRREARLQREIAAKVKQEGKKVRLSGSVEIKDKFIRITAKPKLEKVPRSSSPDNYRECYLSWCGTHSDTDGAWTWENGEPRQWTGDEFADTIKPRLDSYISSPWKEVEAKDYNGKNGTRKLLNKYQPLDSICDEAQLRWMGLDSMSQFEELLRFRLGTNRRIWGVRIQHHFYIVWYERYHKICPIR